MAFLTSSLTSSTFISKPTLRSTTSSPVPTHHTPRPNPFTIRMAVEEKEKRNKTSSQQSLWVDNPFTGGFPGGEGFFKQWVDDGMKDRVPDLADKYQPTSSKRIKKPKPKTPIADTFEYFKDFVGVGTEKKKKKKRGKGEDSVGEAEGFDEDEDENEDEEGAGEEEEEDESRLPEGVTKETRDKQKDDKKVPDERLYEKYYPKNRRNLAPMIMINYEKNFSRDRVGVAMREVTANPTDMKYPKEMKNKAPVIEINYNGMYGGGGLANASIKLEMKDIEGPPPLPPPAKEGETVPVLKTGSGGGLKLDFMVQGQGTVNVYSDPRCVDNYKQMLGNTQSPGDAAKQQQRQREQQQRQKAQQVGAGQQGASAKKEPAKKEEKSGLKKIPLIGSWLK